MLVKRRRRAHFTRIRYSAKCKLVVASKMKEKKKNNVWRERVRALVVDR